MWKNNISRKNLRGVYARYKIRGLNLDRLINTLKKNQITLYSVKKIKQNLIELSINFSDIQKFFAIIDKLCYNRENVVKIKEYGPSYPILYFSKNIGIFIGIIIFILTSILSNDLIFDFSYTGSGNVYSAQVQEYLLERGVKKYAKFSSINLDALADDILADSNSFTFVSCKKKGNRLEIDLTLKQEVTSVLSGKEQSLVSTHNGIIESIKAYRGTALKSVGDKVSVGDIIVDGFMMIKEQTIKVNVIACVSIISEQEIEFFDKRKDKENFYLLLAKETLSDREIINQTIQIIENKDGYVYSINNYCRNVIYVG